MREAAARVLAPQFNEMVGLCEQPFLQPIYDLEVPHMAFGRVALAGDAAFVARPHVGAGVAKAADDALALADALAANADIESALKRFEAVRLPVGNKIIARTRHLGAYVQADLKTRGRARIRRAPPHARGGADRNRDHGFLSCMFPFGDATRELVAQRCAAFTRLASDTEHALKHAAVAVTLVDAEDGPDETALILTGRVSGLRSHGGQWAMPGGRIDPGETPVAAALRELAEEIGLHLTPDDVLGMLDDYPTRSGYLITPVVVWGGHHPPLRLNPREVASVRHIKLADIAREDAVQFDRIPESERRVVRLHINGRTIHAPTAAMIYQFREVIAGRQTRVADLEQPVFAWR